MYCKYKAGRDDAVIFSLCVSVHFRNRELHKIENSRGFRNPVSLSQEAPSIVSALVCDAQGLRGRGHRGDLLRDRPAREAVQPDSQDIEECHARAGSVHMGVGVGNI